MSYFLLCHGLGTIFVSHTVYYPINGTSPKTIWGSEEVLNEYQPVERTLYKF